MIVATQYDDYNYRDLYGNVYNPDALWPKEGRPDDPPGGVPAQPDPGISQPPQPPPVADPWATAPADGNWQNWFLTNTKGLAPTPTMLKSLEDKLKVHGIKVLSNANGIYGKIQLPGGEIIDVIQGAGAGGQGWQWLTGDGGADGPPIEVNPDYLTPFTEQFSYADFDAPTWDSLRANDPGIDFRIKTGRGMYENSAAARGLTNSGGSLYDLAQIGQEMGSQEYGNAFNRAFSLWNTNRDNAWRNYVERKDTFYKNQTNPWTKLYQAGSLGAQASAS